GTAIHRFHHYCTILPIYRIGRSVIVRYARRNIYRFIYVGDCLPHLYLATGGQRSGCSTKSQIFKEVTAGGFSRKIFILFLSERKFFWKFVAKSLNITLGII